MDARFGNKPGGYVWALLDPAAQVLIMTIIFGAIGRTPALGTSFPMFFASGYLAFAFYASMSTYIASAVKANRSLLSYPVVAPIDTVVARFILQFVTSIVVTIVIILIADAESYTAQKFNFPILAVSALMGAFLGLGMGLVNVTLFSRYSLYGKVFALINRPLYLISGVFFLPDDMPHPFREVILLNPIAHLIMWFRSGFYSEYRPEGLDRAYVIESSMVLIFVGLVLLSVSSGHLRSDMR